MHSPNNHSHLPRPYALATAMPAVGDDPAATPGADRLWLLDSDGHLVRADQIRRVTRQYCPPLYPRYNSQGEVNGCSPKPARRWFGLARRNDQPTPDSWDVVIETHHGIAVAAAGPNSEPWARETQLDLVECLIRHHGSGGIVTYDPDAERFRLYS